MEIGETMPIDCDCGEEDCKGHTFPKDQYRRLEKSRFVRLQIKARLWFLFWGVVSVAFLTFASSRIEAPHASLLIGIVIGIVVSGVFLMRFDDGN